MNINWVKMAEDVLASDEKKVRKTLTLEGYKIKVDFDPFYHNGTVSIKDAVIEIVGTFPWGSLSHIPSGYSLYIPAYTNKTSYHRRSRKIALKLGMPKHRFKLFLGRAPLETKACIDKAVAVAVKVAKKLYGPVR